MRTAQPLTRCRAGRSAPTCAAGVPSPPGQAGNGSRTEVRLFLHQNRRTPR
jgi:hypothetical protein